MLNSLRLLVLSLLVGCLFVPAYGQMVSRTVVEAGGSTDLVGLPLPSQRGMFSDASGARYFFASKRQGGSSDCSLRLFKTVDDGLNWVIVTEVPDVGLHICQEDISAQLAEDGCTLHAIWTMRENPAALSRLAYGAYDLCSDAWLGVEEIRPGVNGFAPDLTLYKKGSAELPIIGYTTETPLGLRDGWLNFKKTQSTWLFAQTMPAYRSSFQDYYLGMSLHQKGATLKFYGSIRAAGGLCASNTQLFGRTMKRSEFPFSPPEFFIHGHLSNYQSVFLDEGGNTWICYIAEKDAGCSPGQEIYTMRLPAVGALINVYGISDMETGPPFSSVIPGEDHFNFAITSVGGWPTVIFSRFLDNYETIYVSTFDGFDFGPAQVLYQQPGERYLRFQTFKDDLPCLQFAASAATSAGVETVYFSECGPLARTASTEGEISRKDFLISAASPAFEFSGNTRDGFVEIFDMQGRLVYRGDASALVLAAAADPGLYFYNLHTTAGGDLIQRGKIILQ